MKKQIGFTLVEIMIALLLGLIVIAATISIYIATVGSSASTIRSVRLNHDLESVMTLMINDIRRAGYWAGAADNVSTNNPFTNADAAAGAITNINILDADGDGVDECILYSYDANGNAAADADEFYGFKLQNNTIMMRLSGSGTTDCDDGIWQTFIDNSQLKIPIPGSKLPDGLTPDPLAPGLQFKFTPITGLTATSRCWNQTQSKSDDQLDCTAGNNGDYIIQNRMVNIIARGRVSNIIDTNVTKTLESTVEVRNNRICVWDGATCP